MLCMNACVNVNMPLSGDSEDSRMHVLKLAWELHIRCVLNFGNYFFFAPKIIFYDNMKCLLLESHKSAMSPKLLTESLILLSFNPHQSHAKTFYSQESL